MGSNETLRAVVVSPERTLFDHKVTSVLVPGEKGPFEVLPNHAPIISSLSKGDVICNGEFPLSLSINSGFIEVKDNIVTLCVEVG